MNTIIYKFQMLRENPKFRLNEKIIFAEMQMAH
jgi:hypothetical protein